MGQVRTFLARIISYAVAVAVLLLSPPVSADPGDLDPSFDGDGIATTFVHRGGVPYAVAVQDDGKLILGGTTGSVKGAFALVRFNPGGTLDATFGHDGKVVTKFPDGATIQAVELVESGIIVAGSVGFAEDSRMIVAQYRSGGGLDRTFASDGTATIRFEGGAYAADMALQQNGKVVIVGEALNPQGSRFGVARLTPDGVLDRTFGRDGKVTTELHGDPGAANAIAVSREGILAAGWTAPHPGVGRLAVVRYTRKGLLDRAFSGDGIFVRSMAEERGGDSRGISIAIDADGRAIIGGRVFEADGFVSSAFLLRLGAGGSPDDTFGEDGSVTERIEAASAVRIQADGGIVVAGGICCGGGDESTYVVARFLPTGRLDPAFGDAGIAFADVPSPPHAGPLTDMTLQPDGRIVAVGVAAYSSGFLAVRLLA